MAANAGIQTTTTLAEFRLFAPSARPMPCAAASCPLDTRFRGHDKAAFPELAASL